DDQAGVLFPPELDANEQLNLFSPMLMISPSWRRQVPSVDEARAVFSDYIQSKYKLGQGQMEALAPALDRWQQEVKPHIGPFGNRTFPNLTAEETIAAGRAQLKVYEAVLGLPNLPESVRQDVLAGRSVYAPRIQAAE
ncbi:MAG: hypothetical protein AAF517_22630, partial [Planctomycetota bacterium]